MLTAADSDSSGLRMTHNLESRLLPHLESVDRAKPVDRSSVAVYVILTVGQPGL